MKSRRVVWILTLALVLRLIFVLFISPQPKLAGGDGTLYTTVARNLVNGKGFSYERRPVSNVGPAYPFFLAMWYWTFGGGYLTAARIVQAFLGASTCVVMYYIGREIFSERAGVISALAMAIDPRFIIGVGDIYTETVYIFLLALAMLACVKMVGDFSGKWPVVAGFFSGLAMLCRPILLLFPLIILMHLLLIRGLQGAIKNFIPYALAIIIIITPWIARNYVVLGRFVPIADSEAAAANFWLGSRSDGQWHDSEEFALAASEIAEDSSFVQESLKAIGQNPLDYAILVAKKVIKAYAQPHGTVFFAGPSIKEALKGIRHSRASLEGFLSILQIEGFWPKSMLYLFHTFALAMGTIGLIASAGMWRRTFPLFAIIAYTTLVHGVLTVIPRYLFPIMPYFWIYAAAGTIYIVERIEARKAISQI